MVLTIRVLVVPKTVTLAAKSVPRASVLLESPSSTLSQFRLGSVTFWSYSITIVGLKRGGTRNDKNSQIAHGCYTQKITLKIKKL